MPEDDRDVDANGHGTHVAGTIAGSKFGVAKKAKIIAVKVLSSDGSGSLSDVCDEFTVWKCHNFTDFIQVIKGIEWVINDHREAKRSKKDKRSVANMSLGGGKSRALENAVNYAVFAGVHFAVAGRVKFHSFLNSLTSFFSGKRQQRCLQCFTSQCSQCSYCGCNRRHR